MDMIALVIARSGSERVKNKNTKNFCDGMSLLEIKLKQLKEMEELKDIVVNSDSEEILNIAEAEGVTPVKRDPYFAKSDTPMKQVYQSVAKLNCDLILFANCTSPLISNMTLQSVIDAGHGMIGTTVNSINTVNTVHKFMWNQKHGALYNNENQPRSQDIYDTVEINWAAAVVRQGYMETIGKVVATNWIPFKIPEEEAVDIDTELDWELAKILWEKQLSLGTPQ